MPNFKRLFLLSQKHGQISEYIKDEALQMHFDIAPNSKALRTFPQNKLQYANSV